MRLKFKYLPFVICALIGASVSFDSLATVIQGESTPGTYPNVAVDSAGVVQINGTTSSTVTFPAQGSATAGQTGPLVQAATTTAAPTYTDATTNPLSLTTGGGLRAFLMGGTVDTLTTLTTLTSITNPVAVTGTFWQATQPISGTVQCNAGTDLNTSLLATVAKQPALGTAGTASTDVITVQGIAAMTPLLVDASATTQPVSGTVTVTQGTGTNLHTVIDSGTITTVSAVTAISNALPAGTNVIGQVSIDQTTPGTTNLVALAANQSVNVAQIAGTTTLTGNGVTGAGSQRVTIASDNSPIPISGSISASPASGTVTDCSGTITTGGTAQQMVASNGTRKYLFIQNTSDTTMWINFTTTAVANQPSINITAGSSFVMESNFISTEAVSVIGATTGKAFTCKQAS